MISLAIIPARSGSKRVPNKNIKMLGNIPLIAHTIRAALESQYLDRIVVSTDSEEIAQVALEFGADVPFIRPSELAEDQTPDQPVLRHALQYLKEKDDYRPDIILNLRPTTPFKTAHTIDNVILKIEDPDTDIVRTMSLVEGVHHPYWMYKLKGDGYATPFINGIYIKNYYQSQLLPKAYRINGVVDAYKTYIIYDGDILSNDNMKTVVVPEEESIDIDTEFDFKICESLISFNTKRS